MKKVLLFFALTQAGFGEIKTGTKVPDFQLATNDGKNFKLSEAKGKWVVLEWYNKDCPFVRKHYDSNNMQTLQKTYKDKGVLWYSVISSKEKKQGHLTAQEATDQLKKEGSHAQAFLLDKDGSLGKTMSAKTTPHIFIINPEGSLIYQGAIDDIPSSNTADIAKAKNFVKTNLDLALNGKSVEIGETKAYGCSVKY